MNHKQPSMVPENRRHAQSVNPTSTHYFPGRRVFSNRQSQYSLPESDLQKHPMSPPPFDRLIKSHNNPHSPETEPRAYSQMFHDPAQRQITFEPAKFSKSQTTVYKGIHLRKRVEQLINQRKGHQSKLANQIVGNVYQRKHQTEQHPKNSKPDTENNEQNSDLESSRDSDVDKQVNFLCPIEEEEHSSIRSPLKEYEHGSALYHQLFAIYPDLQDYKVELIPPVQILTEVSKDSVHFGNSGFGQLMKLISSDVEYLKSIFPEQQGSSSKQTYKPIATRVFKKKKPVTLMLNTDFRQEPFFDPIVNTAEHTIYIYPLLLEKAASFLVSGYQQIEHASLNILVEYFLPLATSVHLLSNSSALERLMGASDTQLFYVKDHGTKFSSYARVKMMIQNKKLKFSVQNDPICISFSYLKFLYRQLCIIDNSPRTSSFTRSQEIVHNKGHFAVLTIRINVSSLQALHIQSIESDTSSTQLILCKSGKQELVSDILGFSRQAESSLSFSDLQPGIYELYVSNSEGTAQIQVSSSDDKINLQIRHKEQFRRFTEEIVKCYLRQKNFKLNRYQKQLKQQTGIASLDELTQCILVRCELFIGLWADVLVNLAQNGMRVELEYKNNVMCDLQYKSHRTIRTIESGSYQVIPLRGHSDVTTKPTLAQITIRL